MEANILVISDTHGNSQAIKRLLENYRGLVAAVVHLGDHARDMVRLARTDSTPNMFHIVNGNTDPLVESYDERVINVADKRIFITHGHRYSVKSSLDSIVLRAQELQVDACLFGHTHVQTLFTQSSIVFMNPGSPTYPHPDQERGYGLLRISDEGVITGKLLTYREAREASWQG